MLQIALQRAIIQPSIGNTISEYMDFSLTNSNNSKSGNTPKGIAGFDFRKLRKKCLEEAVSVAAAAQ